MPYNKYLINLTCLARTVRVVDPRFFPSCDGPRASRLDDKTRGKTRSITYGTDQAREVSMIYILLILAQQKFLKKTHKKKQELGLGSRTRVGWRNSKTLITCQIYSFGLRGASFPQNTFSYDSGYWTNRNAYNMNGGLSGFDYQQTKLPTYWSTPFTKICLGMRVGGTTRFVLVSQSAGSLFSLIAGGKYRATSLHRNAWRSLVPNSSLQHHCGRQGFNVVSDRNGWSKARIGIINNNENNCETPDSRVGFGTGGHPDNNLSCGNIARHGGDIGDRTIPAIGYILVM